MSAVCYHITMSRSQHEGEQGFTLIELLVVIAIIGILAAVILTELNAARESGIKAKITSEMDSLRKTAAIEEANYFTYDTVCGSNGIATSTKILSIINSIERFAPETVVCNSDSQEFAASVAVSSSSYWCVDSVGNSVEASTSLDASIPELVCP